MIAVQYGGEDPANKMVHWSTLNAAVSCFCGEVNQLVRVGDRFYCAWHKSSGGATP